MAGYIQPVTDIVANLARNLKYYRAQLALSQRDLAEISGVNRSHLASIESGTQPNTSLRTVEKLAAALGVSALDLLGTLVHDAKSDDSIRSS